jgi:hypothetical protein
VRPLIVVAVVAIGSSPAVAQARGADSARPAQAERQQLDSQIAQGQRERDAKLPPADRFSFGNRAVPAGTTAEGPIAITNGTLDVFGTVRGDVYAVAGDVRVHRGGRITGDCVAIGGQIIIDGGAIDGAKRSMRGAPAGAPAAATAAQPRSTLQSIKLAVGWFAILMMIGLGVMVFAEGSLDGVVIALERGFARAFWMGFAGQLVLLPGLLLVVVALTISVLGILLIPFAIVSYVVAAAGLMTLGFLAVARLTGGALTADAGTTSPRGVHLRALFTGLVVYLALWLLAAAFTWSPVIGALLRALAMAVTWVAATVGLGAALASRAGTQRPGVSRGAITRASQDDLAWQTPTPVTGVAAARRPATPSARA